MKKENYVTFKVAKSLNDKGYPMPNDFAPTWYEAIKWLREEHNIHIRIDCWGENDWCYILYEFTKGSVHKVVDYSYQCYYNTYEDALKEGILEALKLI